MSTILAAKLNGQVVLATDSRTMNPTFSHPISDSTQKVFEIGPGAYYACSGWAHMCDWQATAAQRLARALGINDIRALADALDAISLSRLEETVALLSAAKNLHSAIADAVSGVIPIHGYVLVGTSKGIPGFIGRMFRLIDGQIKPESYEVFSIPEDTLRAWYTRVDPAMVNKPKTWENGLVAGVEGIMADLKLCDPHVGGQIQIAAIDRSGPRWIHKFTADATATIPPLSNNAVLNSNIADVHIGKTTAGTVIFTGDVFMARGYGYPMMQLGYAGMYLWSAAQTSGSSQGGTASASGLTSYPYVAIQSSQIGLYSGGNPSVTLSSAAIYLWSVNGNQTYPYAGLTSTALTFAAGSFSNVLSASQMQMKYSTSVATTINTLGVTMQNGNTFSYVGSTGMMIGRASTLSVPPTLAQMQASTQYVLIADPGTGFEVSLVNGSYSCRVKSSEIVLSCSGGPSTVITSSGLSMYSVGVSTSYPYVTMSSSGGLTIAESDFGARVSLSNGRIDIHTQSNLVQIDDDGIDITRVGSPYGGAALTANSTNTGLVLDGGNNGGYVNLDCASSPVLTLGLSPILPRIVVSCATSSISIGGNQVIGSRQAGLGNPTGWSDSAALSWAQSLYSKLSAHGLIT